jgi:hypothetical protein
MPDVSTDFDDPLIDVSCQLRAWFNWPERVALFSRMGRSVPTVGITGFNQREQVLNQGPGQANRVLLYAGSWPDGATLGKIVPPRRNKGPLERVNATWERVFVLSCWAADPTDLHNPELQIQAVSSLFNVAHAGLRAVLQGDFPGTGEMITDPKVSRNMSFGMEWLFQTVFYCEMRALPIDTSGTPVNVAPFKPT